MVVGCSQPEQTAATTHTGGTGAGGGGGSGPDSGPGGFGSLADSAGTGSSCGSAPLACSADMHFIVDCNGDLVEACGPSQGCSNGACIAACDAAAAVKSSVGCEFFAHVPAASGECYALFVANTWNGPVSLEGDVGGGTIDLSKYTYTPEGSGPGLTLTPIGAGGTIQAGDVGIMFLRGDAFQRGDATGCGYPVEVAEADPAASAWTDPAWSTDNTATALRVVASAPIVLYDIMPFGGAASAIADATMLLPTSTWDTNYIAITPWPYGENEGPPALSIVASSDDTDVVINPTADIQAGMGVPAAPKGQPAHFALRKGQVLRLEQQADLLGSIISANKPIGVWAEQTGINIDQGYADSAHEQIPPVRALGSEYVYARYRNRVEGQDETPPTRITGAVDGTTLSWDPAPPPGAQAAVDKGKSFVVRSSTPFVVKSQDDEHPFYVSTYMTGGVAFQGIGDPEFVNVVPAGQYLSRYLFFTDPTYSETNLVFVRKKGADGVFHDVVLDCAGTLSGWTPVDSAGQYEVTLRDLVRYDFQDQGGCSNGKHEAYSDGLFSVTVWGWGAKPPLNHNSYAYPAGASVQAINPVVVPPDIPN